MKLKYIIGFVFILLSLSVLGVKPITDIQLPADNTGLEILYPKSDVHRMGYDFDFYFHVMNSSNYLVNPNTVNCTFHLYSPNKNEHIIRAIPKPYLDDDLEIEINSSVFTETGNYPYNLWCNSSYEAGFVSGSFDVINRSISLQTIVFIVLGIILGVLGILYYQGFFIGASISLFIGVLSWINTFKYMLTSSMQTIALGIIFFILILSVFKSLNDIEK